MARRWLAFLWLGVLVVAVACGGGEEAPIEDGQFEEFAKGYSVQVPDGWTARPDFLPEPLATDAFFGPDETETVRPNIAVVCEKLPEGTTLTEHSDVKMEIIRRVARVEPEISSRRVAGQEAIVARYEREDSEPPLYRTEVVFVSEACGWSVNLTAPFGQEAEYEPVLEDFLASFRLLP